MRETTAFFSTCPRCKHARLENGYERIELVESLSAGQAGAVPNSQGDHPG
jgi:hypothetical protein